MQNNKDHLVVIWTSGDREVALNMVFMYTKNAKIQDWWENVTLVIWGPSAKLLTEDSELQQYVEDMKVAGVKLMACKACSDEYSVSEGLEKLGVEVIYIGPTMTEFLKGDYKVVSF